MNTINHIRKTICHQRKQLSKAQLDAYANKIGRRVITNALYLRSKKIAIYLSCQGEVATSEIIKNAWKLKKEIYLPVLFACKQHPLLFAKFTPDTRLHANKFKMLEPKISPQYLLKPKQLDLVITPLVAFDIQCQRIGMGGGYYDRSFSFLTNRLHRSRPYLLGLAYEFQKTEIIASNVWDVDLDFVISDKALYKKP